MKLLHKYTPGILLSAILALALISCGDSTRNDQGVSFTFLGWYQNVNGSIGATFYSAPLSSITGESGGERGDITSFAGVQNHLTGQTVRVRRVYHSYVIPGSSISIPSTAVTLTAVLAPTGTIDETFNSESTLPESFNSGETIYYGEVPLVPASIRSFLNLNRSELPELPFTMIVRSYAEGVTSAGNTITTNDVDIEVIFTADVIIPPTSGDTAATTLTTTDSNFQLNDSNAHFALDDFDSEF